MKLIIKLSDGPKMLEEMIRRMAAKKEYIYLKAIVEIFDAKNAESERQKNALREMWNYFKYQGVVYQFSPADYAHLRQVLKDALHLVSHDEILEIGLKTGLISMEDQENKDWDLEIAKEL